MADTPAEHPPAAADEAAVASPDEIILNTDTEGGAAAAPDEAAKTAEGGQAADSTVTENKVAPAEDGKDNGETAASPQVPTTDHHVETEDMITWKADGAVKIRYGDSGMEAIPSMTVMSMLKSTVKAYPNHTALAYKEGDQWHKVTYSQYRERIWATAKSMIKVGLEAHKGVGILGFNCAEWFYSHMGAVYAGGLSCGVYTTNSAEACAYVLGHADANICVVENDQQMKKILQVWDQLPHLKAVVQYRGKPDTDKDNVYSWDDFIKLGKDVPDAAVQERIDAQYVNQCCSLIYTSGTTGTPKGVMLSHDNITYAARAIGQTTQIRSGVEKLISYLPLSHIAAQLLDVYCPACYGAAVYFAQPDALKGTLNTTMKEVSPTIFFGVPRVFEKMVEQIKITLSGVTGIKKAMINWGRGVATKTAQNMAKGQGDAFGMGIANKLIFKTIKANLGLTQCRWLYTGAAPLSRENHDYFASLGLPLMEVYGMSECTGAVTMTVWSFTNKHWRPGSAGYFINGYGYDLLNKDEKGNGEVAMKGRNCFMGYLKEEEKTKETYDDEYRLKSGDIGFTDPDGFLFITGRIKELLITAGGENVAPVPIEDLVKEALPQVSNCMLIGDKKKFLSMLISLKTIVDVETMIPMEDFTPQTIAWCKSIGSSATKVSDIVDGKDGAVTKAIQEGIDKANAKSESRAKKITKFVLLPEDFSIPGGELGPTLKLKRPVATAKYADLIESMYKE